MNYKSCLKHYMRFILLLALSFFTMATALAQYNSKRQVIIFGSPQSKPVMQQLALLKKEAAGVEERDIEITLAPKEMKWHKKYNVAPSDTFTLLLIGKDGGEKYRVGKPTAAQELFAIIDAMPMRQSEMHRNKKP